MNHAGPEAHDAMLGQLLSESVREAGDLALQYFQRDPKVREKSDGSPVSEADLAVDRLLRDRLIGADTSKGWISEESESRPSAFEDCWIVDPIDGTRAFIDGKPEWTISVALVRSGEPQFSAVYNPASGEFYCASKGKGAQLNGKPIAPTDRAQIAGSRIATSRKLLKSSRWPEPWPDMEIRWINSIAYRLCLVASGDVDAVLSLSAKSDWDLAAADLIVREAGGCLTNHHGARLTYGRSDGNDGVHKSVVAAGPRLHKLLIERTDCMP